MGENCNGQHNYFFPNNFSPALKAIINVVKLSEMELMVLSNLFCNYERVKIPLSNFLIGFKGKSTLLTFTIFP